MHFWIDKRSPQCGFGRSRVAASLSGAGGSYGHPPRRSAANKISIPVHRHQQAATAQQHNAVTGAGGSNSSCSNNNNNSTSSNTQHSATSRNLTRSNYQYQNNNRQQHQNQPTNSSSNSNNNHTSAQSLIISPTENNASIVPQTANMAHQQQRHRHDMRSYHHPQFGNMSVRPYHQTQQQQCNVLAAQQSPAVPQQPNNDIPNETVEISLQNQNPNQTANTSMELHQASPRIAATSTNVRALPSTALLGGGAVFDYSNNLQDARLQYQHIANITNSSNNPITTGSNHHHYHHQQQQPQQHRPHRRTVQSVESTDLQFLPLHLKCGIFASLVLAVAFIVGIKVYFDNHGTKFEVGLFWLLTATFVFAFCFVSICKVPRVLFATTSSVASSRSDSRDQHRGTICGSMDDNRDTAAYEDIVVCGLNEQQQQQQQHLQHEQHQQPPPYHIAILLPESKGKDDTAQTEESPPPSYDKILI